MCWMCDENDGEMIGCQDCGCLICFDSEGESINDIDRTAYVTSSGDVYCIIHGREHDEAEEQMMETEACFYPDDHYLI